MLSTRQIRLAGWSVVNLKNWLEVIESRRRNRPLSEIRLRDGTRLHVTGDERQPFFEIFSEKKYDHAGLSVPENGTVVDIGANVGMYAIYAALNLVPKGTVFAYEPNPVCAARIQENCSLNRIENVSVINRAVAKMNGKVSFNIAERSGDSSVFAIPDRKTIDYVEGIRPEKLLSAYPKIDLLKIDCEGGEFIVLWETSAAEWERVKAVSMEYHLGFNTGYPDSSAKLIEDRLREFGFKILLSEPTPNPSFGYIIASKN
jgi:FkbM family methyltransferase